MKFSEYENVEKQYGIGSGDWLNLKVGENRIRIISQFEIFGNHYNPTTKKGMICIGKDKGCIGCKAGVRLNVRALGWVIDRSDGKIKLFRMPYSVFKAIGELQKAAEYEFETVPDYDITIKKQGEGLDTEYSVIPARSNTEITGEELEEISKVVKPVIGILDKMKAKEQPIEKDAEITEEELPSEEKPPLEIYDEAEED